MKQDALYIQYGRTRNLSATMIASIRPGPGNPFPQYLMAARPSVFQSLGQSFPQYNGMYGLITSSNPVMFKVSSNSRDWLAKMKGSLRAEAISNTVCGCDYAAPTPISNDSPAPAVCTATCAGHGGWNGQWTNQYPAAQSGSACGCTACPAP